MHPDWEEIPAKRGAGKGPKGHKPAIAWLHSVFPDLDIKHEEFVVAGDHVAVRSVNSGTHSGELLGVPATGKKVSYRQFDFHELRGGRIVKTRHLGDFLALAQQIGAAAAPSEEP